MCKPQTYDNSALSSKFLSRVCTVEIFGVLQKLDMLSRVVDYANCIASLKYSYVNFNKYEKRTSYIQLACYHQSCSANPVSTIVISKGVIE